MTASDVQWGRWGRLEGCTGGVVSSRSSSTPSICHRHSRRFNTDITLMLATLDRHTALWRAMLLGRVVTRGLGAGRDGGGCHLWCLHLAAAARRERSTEHNSQIQMWLRAQHGLDDTTPSHEGKWLQTSRGSPSSSRRTSLSTLTCQTRHANFLFPRTCSTPHAAATADEARCNEHRLSYRDVLRMRADLCGGSAIPSPRTRRRLDVWLDWRSAVRLPVRRPAGEAGRLRGKVGGDGLGGTDLGRVAALPSLGGGRGERGLDVDVEAVEVVLAALLLRLSRCFRKAAASPASTAREVRRSRRFSPRCRCDVVFFTARNCFTEATRLCLEANSREMAKERASVGGWAGLVRMVSVACTLARLGGPTHKWDSGECCTWEFLALVDTAWPCRNHEPIHVAHRPMRISNNKASRTHIMQQQPTHCSTVGRGFFIRNVRPSCEAHEFPHVMRLTQRRAERRTHANKDVSRSPWVGAESARGELSCQKAHVFTTPVPRVATTATARSNRVMQQHTHRENYNKTHEQVEHVLLRRSLSPTDVNVAATHQAGASTRCTTDTGK